jgi:hypothetical protein
MKEFTCSTCGKVWPENYCPECARTIDRTLTGPPPADAPVKAEPSQTLWALNMVSKPLPPKPVASAPANPPRPAVVPLYRIWCGLILMVYVAIAMHEGLILAGKEPPELGLLADVASRDDPKLRGQLLAEERENSIIGVGLAAAGSALFLLGMFSPRTSWAWVLGCVAIVVSIVPLCVSVAVAVPLLVFWLKPETRQYFGRR